MNTHTQATPEIARATVQPVTAGIYQLDALVRRAPSLQLTADGQAARLSQHMQGNAV